MTRHLVLPSDLPLLQGTACHTWWRCRQHSTVDTSEESETETPAMNSQEEEETKRVTPTMLQAGTCWQFSSSLASPARQAWVTLLLKGKGARVSMYMNLSLQCFICFSSPACPAISIWYPAYPQVYKAEALSFPWYTVSKLKTYS